MTKEVTIKQSYEIDFENNLMIQTLKQTVAQGTTDAEFQIFCEFCKSTKLNPFKKEIWCIVTGTGQYRKMQLMTGINGFHAIANSHPMYDGMEIGLIGKNGEYLPMTYPNNDFIGAWAKVYRKDRRIPVEGVAMLSEYDKKHGNWITMKRVMINKCSESVGLRKAFPQELNGIYTQEEMPLNFAKVEEEKQTNTEAESKNRVIVAEAVKQEEIVLPFVYCFLGATEADKRLAMAEFKKMKHAIEENGVKILVKTDKKLSEKWDAYILDFPEITFNDDELPDSYHQAKINNETINLKTGEVVE